MSAISPTLPLESEGVYPKFAAMPSQNQGFIASATATMNEVQQAVRGLVAAMPGGINKAVDVQRAFAVEYQLGWKIYQIARAEDPLAATSHVPVRAAMERLFKAAARRRVPAEVVNRVRQSLDAFDRLIEEHADNRPSLEAMVNAHLPEAREKQELVSRQAAFESMSQLCGVMTEASIYMTWLLPSTDGRSVDVIVLCGSLGLRRTRPGILIAATFRNQSGQGSRLTLEGRPLINPSEAIVEQFSTAPLPSFDIRQSNTRTVYQIPGQEVGLKSGINLFYSDCDAGTMPRYRKHGICSNVSFCSETDAPLKRLTRDIFVHRDIYPNIMPQLGVYTASACRLLEAFDGIDRHQYSLSTQETIRVLTGGFTDARLPHVPRYAEMLEFVYNQTGLDPAMFRGYRLDVPYPIYGASYDIEFQLPEPPIGT